MYSPQRRRALSSPPSRRMLTAVASNGLALKMCSPALRADRELVLVAVKNDGLEFARASARRRQGGGGRRVWLLAARRFASEQMREDPDVAFSARPNYQYRGARDDDEIHQSNSNSEGGNKRGVESSNQEEGLSM